MSELISTPIKKFTLSQALVAATKPRVILPLQFGLAVSVDNQLASKWLNTTLSKLGLAVSYDEVSSILFLLQFFKSWKTENDFHYKSENIFFNSLLG